MILIVEQGRALHPVLLQLDDVDYLALLHLVKEAEVEMGRVLGLDHWK